MARRNRQHERGLPSLNEARVERRRAFALGKVRLRAMPPQFWLWTGLGMAAFGVTYWRVAAVQLESQKSAVMAKQRAVSKTLGPRIVPFVDRVENWCRDLAGPLRGDEIGAGASWESISHEPGVYFRLRQEDATDKVKIGRAATSSLHDGFTSCFFVGDAASSATEGPKCLRNADCASGLLCNDWEVCVRPPRPYNMRLAYRALRVLTSDWTNQLYGATSDLEVRVQERDLEQVTRVDVPVAIELLQRAKYATVVLDEPPAATVAQANGTLPGESPEARIQRLPHAARVGIWNLLTGQPIVRWRGMAEGRLVSAGRPTQLDPETSASRSRQANSCMLAWELKERLINRNKDDSTRSARPTSPDANGR